MTSRVDMHCHSTASQLSRLGVQRSLGLPECATPPEEVYELAKRRGMDFVTITDHDTIDGCLELADRPDCFVSEELTARFAGEPQAVHVLCYGITPGDHEWLQAHSGDVEACAAYLHENEIACALAHPFFNVAAPLTRRHRRRLAELFPVWEVRNGSRAAELNMPAVIYIETHGGTGIGGSDDHAGVDIGRTFTEVPAAATPEEFLRHLRGGDAEAGGEQGSAAKWTHAAMALATRALRPRREGPAMRRAAPDPAAVLKMAERVIREGAAREGKVAADIGPDDARGLLEAWLADRARPARPRADRLPAVRRLLPRRPLPARPPHPRPAPARRGRAGRRRRSRGRPRAARSAASSRRCVPAVPYAPATVLPRRREGEARRRGGGAAAGRADRRRDRLDARRHPHDRADPRARRARLRGRGDRHRRRRRPPPARRRRAGDALLRGDEPRRPGPARPGRDPGRGPLRPGPRHRSRARPGSRRPCSAGSPACRCSPATTPSWPPTPACAAATAASRRSPEARSAPSTARPRWSSRRARRPTARCSRSASSRPGSAAGSAASTSTASTRQGRPRRLPGRDQGPLRRPPDPREGRRPAGRELPARPRAPTRACTCCWPAAAPRRRSCARGSASTRPSSAGSRARSWPAPTPAPTSSSSAAAPTPTAR